MAVSITPVVTGAAINGPPPPAPSIYKKAICFPSCDQRGRAAYPFRCVFFLGLEPSAFTVQIWAWSFSPVLKKNASVLESGDQVGCEFFLSPVAARLTGTAAALPDVPQICVRFDVVAAVDCTHATREPSGERATSS